MRTSSTPSRIRYILTKNARRSNQEPRFLRPVIRCEMSRPEVVVTRTKAAAALMSQLARRKQTTEAMA